MFAAAQSNDGGAAVKVLVDGNLNMQDDRGNTALLWAALSGQLENVMSLVEMGAQGKHHWSLPSAYTERSIGH